MIKTTRPKFIQKNEVVKVSMDGSTKELIEEYAEKTKDEGGEAWRNF